MKALFPLSGVMNPKLSINRMSHLIQHIILMLLVIQVHNTVHHCNKRHNKTVHTSHITVHIIEHIEHASHVIKSYIMLVSYVITNFAWYVSILGIDIIVGAPKALGPALIEFWCFENSANNSTIYYCIFPVNKLTISFPDLDKLILQMVISH